MNNNFRDKGRLILSSSFLFALCFLSLQCGPTQKSSVYRTKVVDVSRQYLLLDKGNKWVGMVGIYIPDKADVNYLPEVEKEIKEMLIGKSVDIETVERKHSTGYPKADLVKVYLKGELLNEYLLENGKAFFFEDYWDKKEKEKFRQLEVASKKQGIGLWAKKNQFKVLLVRDRHWKNAYAPDCKDAQNIPAKNKIEYFVPIPQPPEEGVLVDLECGHPDPSLFAETRGSEETGTGRAGLTS